MAERKIIGYGLQAVHPVPPGGIAAAALMTCAVSGDVLSGMGGGGEYISPAVRAWLLGAEGRAAYADHLRTQRLHADLDAAADGLERGAEVPGAGSAK